MTQQVWGEGWGSPALDVSHLRAPSLPTQRVCPSPGGGRPARVPQQAAWHPGASRQPPQRGTREHSQEGGSRRTLRRPFPLELAPRGGLGASCRVGVASGPGSKPLDLPLPCLAAASRRSLPPWSRGSFPASVSPGFSVRRLSLCWSLLLCVGFLQVQRAGATLELWCAGSSLR